LHSFLPDFVIQAGFVFLFFRNPVVQLKKAFNWAQNDFSIAPDSYRDGIASI